MLKLQSINHDYKCFICTNMIALQLQFFIGTNMIVFSSFPILSHNQSMLSGQLKNTLKMWGDNNVIEEFSDVFKLYSNLSKT